MFYSVASKNDTLGIFPKNEIYNLKNYKSVIKFHILINSFVVVITRHLTKLYKQDITSQNSARRINCIKKL